MSRQYKQNEQKSTNTEQKTTNTEQKSTNTEQKVQTHGRKVQTHRAENTKDRKSVILSIRCTNKLVLK